jgi:hypothetical protein
MKNRVTWMAWSIWGLSLTLILISNIFVLVDWSVISMRMPDNPPILSITGSMFPIAFATVGALIASRHYHNPVGWIFSAVGCLYGIIGFSEGYAIHALLAVPGSLPGGEIMAWIASWISGPSTLFPFILLFLVFPNGRLLSHRWRIVVGLASAVLGAYLFMAVVRPGPLQFYPFVNNPFGIDSLSGLVARLEGPLFFLMLASLLASVLSLVLRFRRSRGEERQQLKWLASAGILLLAIFATGPFFWTNTSLPSLIWPVLARLGFMAIPIAAGIAIFKYRLYDIDVIINRTLVYGALTAALALVYIVSVVLLRQLLAPLTGSSEVAIVASTLAIAALFTPLRRRIQNLIDKRFYRRKYDAAKVLAAFGATGRDETDLDALTDELLRVVDETMQPEFVGLWLREPGRDK